MPHYIRKNWRNNFLGPPPPIDPVPSGPEWVDRTLRAQAETPYDLLKTQSQFMGGHPPQLANVFPDRIIVRQFAEVPAEMLRTHGGFWSAKPDYVAPPTPVEPTDYVDLWLRSSAEIPPQMFDRMSSRLIPPPTRTGLGPEEPTLQAMIVDSAGIEATYKTTSVRLAGTYKAKGGLN